MRTAIEIKMIIVVEIKVTDEGEREEIGLIESLETKI